MAKERMMKLIAAFLIFFFAAVYITYPLVFHLGDFTTGLGDELLIAWIQNWVLHALTTQPLSLFEANIYFPYHTTLAYSDLFLTSSILSAIPLMLVGQPIAVVNFTFFSSLMLLGFSIYLLCFYLTKNFFASLLPGILVIFSPAVLSYSVHLQVLAIQWVPLSILFFLVFVKSKKSKYLAVSLLFFLFQIYNSFLPGYFILFSYLIIFVFEWFYKRKQIIGIITKKNIFIVIISLLLVFPVIIPYLKVSREFNYTRDIRESVHNAFQLEDMFYSSAHSRLSNYLNNLPFNKHSQNNEFKSGYLGFIFSLLCLFAIFYSIKNLKKRGFYRNSFFTIGVVSFILSLGPALHLGRQTVHWPVPIPLPYALFYYLLPGFKGFRTPVRWEMLFIICFAVVISLILSKILEKYSSRNKILIYLLLFSGTVIEFNFPMQFISISQKKDFPRVYSWLNTIPTNASIIEFPIYTWNMSPYVFDENKRTYYSIVHFRKMVNGASGFSPPPWQEMVVMLLKDFPSEKTIKLLKEININYIIVHKREYDILNKQHFKVNRTFISNGDYVVNALSTNKRLRFIKKSEDDYIFQIRGVYE